MVSRSGQYAARSADGCNGVILFKSLIYFNILCIVLSSNFYHTQGSEAFILQLNAIVPGTKVAAFVFERWHRAEIIAINSETTVDSGNNVNLFFLDYGTRCKMNRRHIKILIEDFAKIKRKSFRGCLHGIQPVGGSQLWDLKVIEKFVDNVREKIHTIEFIKYNQLEDFNEFLLYAQNGDSETINEQMIDAGLAERAADAHATCIQYPPFNFLEKLIAYPSFADRYLMMNRDIDFNLFEVNNIPIVLSPRAYENALCEILKQDKFSAFREYFLRILHK